MLRSTQVYVVNITSVISSTLCYTIIGAGEFMMAVSLFRGDV